MTRVQMRHLWDVPAAVFRFRRLNRQRHQGLLRSSLALENTRTFITISVWRSEDDINLFGNVIEHVRTVRWTMRRAREIWSARCAVERLSHRPMWDDALIGQAQDGLRNAS